MEEMEEKDFGEFASLLISSGVYKTELTKKFINRPKWIIPDPKKIKAVIPGTILDVFVKAGQQVKKGETLLLLEAMKMQNQIIMPFDGKIKKVYVQPEEKIKKMDLMIEIV